VSTLHSGGDPPVSTLQWIPVILEFRFSESS
jgi:hypothetical protein